MFLIGRHQHYRLLHTLERISSQGAMLAWAIAVLYMFVAGTSLCRSLATEHIVARDYCTGPPLRISYGGSGSLNPFASVVDLPPFVQVMADGPRLILILELFTMIFPVLWKRGMETLWCVPLVKQPPQQRRLHQPRPRPWICR